MKIERFLFSVAGVIRIAETLKIDPLLIYYDSRDNKELMEIVLKEVNKTMVKRIPFVLSVSLLSLLVASVSLRLYSLGSFG